ncbi:MULTISPECIES: DEAD/DEAH box helicase [Klebsiella]|uniref:Helicase n=2 Tax=Enterobacteriaceae TaxID=543 RepID=A0AAD3UJK2_KLEOX|nr:helicase-related protein [Klebsiella michiganensis]ELT9682516.1 DEAD/DEAH box helicase family protein [Klebsiella oxytoca]ELT9976134.1 DEAD/DEAH box helicase family protein [Klebsiella oxytoca]MBL6086744.1 DEAD/DEAH box helicase family protein [Klebsiella oxytoca]MBL6250866.1 DEAD/DEAH box helicase family protein [Klebsiella oxytoca]MBL6273482.1 DEAD/DEAH box helicase family protein [Klebsiella oxytoca]
MWKVGDWAWSQAHQQYVRVIDAAGLWGQQFYRVWLQQQDVVLKVLDTDLYNQPAQTIVTADALCYLATAAKIANVQQEDTLLAPIESNVIPLPHQLKALTKAMSKKQVRYLFADEVGLGKTIEAGLVMRELKLRGLAKRILVCVPKGLVSQWVSEMQTHFNESFQLMLPGEQKPQNEHDNIWSRHDQVVCPVDSIKPIESRKGWSLKQLNEYNKLRFDDLLAAGWDLIVIDEAHRLGGSTDQVARYKLGQGLAQAAPYFLLLSATPHQGKSDAFHRLMALLDAEAFPDLSAVTQERVQPFVVRTEKRVAIDGEGKPLFCPRQTEMVAVAWQAQHGLQRHLYEEVTEYIKEGYNQAQAKQQNAIGFLMILMQRLVSSSSAAISRTLDRRLKVLENKRVEEELPLAFADEWADLDGQTQLDELLAQCQTSLENEKKEVRRLLALAEQCVSAENDAKAEALFDCLYRLQQEEGDPYLKMLVFTEFVPTQEMLAQFFVERGISVVSLNGSMDLSERKKVQAAFASDTRILISTDAGGEGLNLQFCHVIVNYDMPWNPMRMEQRIGRVDRIGQQHIVRALNFVLEDTVEHRVREVLEAKLQIILDEFGVDKTSDVLDSSAANHLFDDLFITSITDPTLMDQELAKALATLRDGAVDKRQQDALFGGGDPLSADDYRQALNHTLPYWVQSMVASYLHWHHDMQHVADFTDESDGSHTLTWPDGATWSGVTFVGKIAQQQPNFTHLTLENPKIKGLCSQLPVWSEAQPIPCVAVNSLPAGANGYWALWSIRLVAGHERRCKYMPVYIKPNGQYYATASQRVWDAVCSKEFEILPQDLAVDSSLHMSIYALMHKAAQEEGKAIFESMLTANQADLDNQFEKGEYSFNARKKAIERVGLPEVRQFRLRQLSSEYALWLQDIDKKRRVIPDMVLHTIIEIKG